MLAPSIVNISSSLVYRKLFSVGKNTCKFYSSQMSPRICIVGSGPAGFYAAQHLLKALPNAVIDMYEKLPVPFGLVRYGVAPDHPEVKNVINSFTKTASHSNFNFVGNVNLGVDVLFRDLKNAYHGIVLAYGCSEEKKLGIKGEDKTLSARRFVGWYNGLPDDKDLKINLDSEEVLIIGQGNVAIDVARIILTPLDILKKTDITAYALEILSKSKVKKVNLVGRRGPLQVAFTIKEFREMTKLPGVNTLIKPSDLAGLEDILPDLPRPRKRLTELLLKTAQCEQSGDGKVFCPSFFLKPYEIVFDNNIKGVKFNLNVVKDNLKGIVESTNNFKEIPCNMCISSVGYKGVKIDSDVPFNDETGTVNTQLGVQVVSFEGWRKIDKVEIEKGEKVGKPREKIVDIEEMLKIGGE
ncbi:NADPH:adrenodoxin oxidoreductase, mitochondrial isoform X2 [Halyomorpha halys]|uniref:NADPH:adrenodoxin oxidoreductase, mitochondrial isoform X2 n=1 Tax=Halyomorpha halys TaxID=286706 RepID=UPI000D0C8F3E|nr:NADPH:adrenodoxin oxidoreductase, mitochondrial isoform X2 [Halyomorpha halys]